MLRGQVYNKQSYPGCLGSLSQWSTHSSVTLAMARAISLLSLTVISFGVRIGAQDTRQPLFTYETNALNDDTLKSLINSSGISSDAALFAFDDERVSTSDRLNSGACKVFPGDTNWPSQATWRDFNRLLGGALIETIPLAAPCYQNLGAFSAEKCAAIRSNWTDPYLQYVPTSKCDKWPLADSKRQRE